MQYAKHAKMSEQQVRCSSVGYHAKINLAIDYVTQFCRLTAARAR